MKKPDNTLILEALLSIMRSILYDSTISMCQLEKQISDRLIEIDKEAKLDETYKFYDTKDSNNE